MSAIAEQAQVSKANIFHHYKSKKALYVEVMQQACADSSRALDELEQTDGDVEQRVRHYARQRLASYIDQPQAMRLILRELTHDSDQSGLQLVREDFAATYNRLISLIRTGQHTGHVRQDLHPGVVAMVMSAASVFFAQLRPGLSQFPDNEYLADPDAFSEMVMDIIFHGVTPPGPHPTPP